MPCLLGLCGRLQSRSLVGMQLGRPVFWPPYALPYRRHRLDHWLEELAVARARRREEERERDAVAVDEEMALGTRSTAVGRGSARSLRPPFSLQTTCYRLLPDSSRSRWSYPGDLARRGAAAPISHPAACQSRNPRQQVMPDPQRISSGR